MIERPTPEQRRTLWRVQWMESRQLTRPGERPRVRTHYYPTYDKAREKANRMRERRGTLWVVVRAPEP